MSAENQILATSATIPIANFCKSNFKDFSVLKVLEIEISKNCIAMLGESAGGNLALVTMFRAKKMGLNLPVAAALISPWCDLTNLGDSMVFNDGRDPTLSLQQSNMAASHYASGQDLTNPEISPIFGEFDHTFPNFFISTGWWYCTYSWL